MSLGSRPRAVGESVARLPVQLLGCPPRPPEGCHPVTTAADDAGNPVGVVVKIEVVHEGVGGAGGRNGGSCSYPLTVVGTRPSHPPAGASQAAPARNPASCSGKSAESGGCRFPDCIRQPACVALPKAPG